MGAFYSDSNTEKQKKRQFVNDAHQIDSGVSIFNCSLDMNPKGSVPALPLIPHLGNSYHPVCKHSLSG